MTVLVTGGAGFIGSHTVDALVKHRHRVRILDALTRPVHPKKHWPPYIQKNVGKILGDVRAKNDWLRALRGIDVVYHFAAYQDYNQDFSKYVDVNTRGTALLYELIVTKKLPIKRIVLASSQAVYGEGRYHCQTHDRDVFPSQRSTDQLNRRQWDVTVTCASASSNCHIVPTPTREDDPLKPHNAYAMSKRSQEEIALSLGKRYNVPTIVLRYSISQGARQSPHNPYSGALRQFVTSLLQNRKPTIYEDGEQLRDFVNIHDVVNANVMALTDDRMVGEIYNVGSGKVMTVNALYRNVQHVLKSTVTPKRNNSFRLGDTRHILSSIAKLKKLGWSPRRSIDQSVQEYVHWIKSA